MGRHVPKNRYNEIAQDPEKKKIGPLHNPREKKIHGFL